MRDSINNRLLNERGQCREVKGLINSLNRANVEIGDATLLRIVRGIGRRVGGRSMQNWSNVDIWW